MAMDSSAGGAIGVMLVLGILVGAVFLIMLFVAPIKLYAIHSELRTMNRTLAAQNELLTAIATEIHFGGLRPTPPTAPPLPSSAGAVRT